MPTTAATPTAPRLTGLPYRLVQDNLLDATKALEAQRRAATDNISFVKYLVGQKILDSHTIAQAASQEFGVPFLDLNALELTEDNLEGVSPRVIREHDALPIFKRGKRLFIAVSDPTNVAALDAITFQTKLNTDMVLVEHNKLQRAIDDQLSNIESHLGDLSDVALDNLKSEAEDDNLEEQAANAEVDDAPIVRFVHKIMLDAINKGASDIHFEPYEASYRVRLRVDGILHEVAAPPAALGSRLCARLKVMSRLDIAERRVPQDGRIKLNLSRNRSIDFRVNTCPTLYGEKVVLRILDADGVELGLDDLGFDAQQKALYLGALQHASGMILVTGPTGSGKTVSLYTGLNYLNTPERNIFTAEDPVEIQLQGINQSHVNPKVGFTFANALRAFLRQDPDIIMVGEIRDLETAEIAIKASQTGHLVLSTLHTNDAPQTLTRLHNMGVPPYSIASSVHLIIAQRLARRLCEQCKTPHELPAHSLLEEGFEQAEIKHLTVYKPVGCSDCTGGYKGRVGLFQVMPVSEEMSKIILAGGSALELEKQAEQEGVHSLRRAGLNRVKAGITTLEEVNRVTHD